MCCLFITKEETTWGGSWGEFRSLFCRRRVCLQSSCDQLLVPRRLMWKSVIYGERNTDLSCSSLEVPLYFLPFKTPLLGPGPRRRSLDTGLPSSQAADFLNRATFPFHPARVSWVLAFEHWAAKLVFFVCCYLFCFGNKSIRNIGDNLGLLLEYKMRAGAVLRN